MDAKLKRSGVADARANVVNFYNRLPNHSDYDEVDESDFFIVANRVRNERSKKVDTQKSEMFKERYHSMGPPPKKTARSPVL
jgi:hypothetical protein